MKKIFSLYSLSSSLFVAAFCFMKSRRHSLWMLLTFLVLTGSPSLNATETTTESDEVINLDGTYYIGGFLGSGKAHNKHTDIEGFANWGYPGSFVDYDNTETIGGVLVGRKFNGLPLRFEVDTIFGDMSASSNKLDPKGLDETVKTDVLWILTARAGLEKDLGLAKLFANGGLAIARISNSVVDIDFSFNKPPQKDPDDSFSDNSIHLGWVIGIGAEMPLSGKTLPNDEGWTLRVDGSYINFGENTYQVNHSGNNRCGHEGPRRPCSYNIKNEVSLIRLALIRRFSL